MKLLLVGGGSGGSVFPLIAVAAELKNKQPSTRILLVGTAKGPERLMAKAAGIGFVSIPSGKLRRYFSFSNLLSPFFVLAGFTKAFIILKRFKPDCVFGAGS